MVELDASDGPLSIMAGESVSILVTAKNTGPLPTRVALGGSTIPVGWFYDFAPQRVTLAAAGTAGAWNNTTLTVSAPADAATGSNVTLTFSATETDGLQREVSDALFLNFTLVAPPAPEARAAPSIGLAISASSGASGTVVEGYLSLESADAATLDAIVDIDGKTAWAPRIKDDIHDIKLFTHTPRSVTARVTVPATAAAGATETFTLVLTVGEFTFTRAWNVTSTGAPAAASAPPPEEDATQPAPTTDGAKPTPTTPTPPPTIGLLALPSVGSIEVASGETSSVTVRLENTGTVPLQLRLTATVGDGTWPKSLGSDSLLLAPGEKRDVPLGFSAPRDLPPGGKATATVTITGESGLFRSVPFELKITPAPPRDDSAPAASDAQAPLPGPTGLSPVTVTLVAGLGAVGAGALALANRPLREKLLWGAAGMYTRLARPDVLGHDERQRLYTLIESRPGIHFHALQRELSWNTGTLTYHLRVLEKHGFVVDRRDGAYRRFYITGAAPRKETFSVDAPQGLRADVLEAIQNRHGISQSDLALALGANKQTVNYHVKALERTGAIRIEKRGRDTFLYPIGAAGVATGEVRA